MKYFVSLFNLLMIFGCSETPSDVPIDSYRDVAINVDMNKTIADGLFDVNIDALALLLDSVDEYVMNDENSDQIFSITISNLIFGKTYIYQYSVNDNFELLEGDRTFTVYDVGNSVSDYYGELNLTIIIFRVNMSKQIELGNFDSEVDFLDVAGTFNNWNGTDYHLVAIENNVYTITIREIKIGDEIEFKFRIDGSWDKGEFHDGDNRSYTVEQGENSLEYWFNEENGN